MSSNFSNFQKSTTEKEKETSHARQITIGRSNCFVLPCTDSNLRPFTAVVRHFKLPLPSGCVRSDFPILTHLHPSFGHGQAMRVYQASLLFPSVMHNKVHHTERFGGSGGSRDPLKTALVPKPLVLFTSYQKAILVDCRCVLWILLWIFHRISVGKF
jgi:hypothetical protein